MNCCKCGKNLVEKPRVKCACRLPIHVICIKCGGKEMAHHQLENERKEKEK